MKSASRAKLRVSVPWPVLLACFLTAQSSARAFYNLTTGRWLSRDPIAEKGGRNICGFVGNNPVGRVDRLGLNYYIKVVKLESGVKTHTGG